MNIKWRGGGKGKLVRGWEAYREGFSPSWGCSAGVAERWTADCGLRTTVTEREVGWLDAYFVVYVRRKKRRCMGEKKDGERATVSVAVG